MKRIFTDNTFSLLYGGEKFKSASDVQNEKNISKIYHTAEKGLKVTQVIERFEQFDAERQTLYFENTGSEDTPILSDIKDCDILLPLKENHIPTDGRKIDESLCSTLWVTKGANDTNEDFSHKAYSLCYYGMEKKLKNNQGRSSDGLMPYFDVNLADEGYIIAIGWSGQWNAYFRRDENGMYFSAGLEDSHFTLHAGEKIRTASILIMRYENGQTNGHNKFRRLMKEHFSIVNKRIENPPFSVTNWGAETSENMIKTAKLCKKYDMGIEYFWVDAGWYGFGSGSGATEAECNWWEELGSWNINENYHPDGFKDVVKEVKNAGMKFLLWFEPERAYKGNYFPDNFPQYFLLPKKPDRWGNMNYLWNFGDETARNACFDMLSEKIKELDISCLRWDFNMQPLEQFRSYDDENRRGITEIKYITGLYKLWDMLLERFPNLIIDNCASGGKRLDFELIGRGIPLWRSDRQCAWDREPEENQNHNIGLSWYLPFHGTGCGLFGKSVYALRSAYSPALVVASNYINGDENTVNWIKGISEEYKSIRKYFSCDFYPLTGLHTGGCAWNAYQFDCPETKDGIILIFRKKGSLYTVAKLKLHADKPLILENADTKQIHKMTAEECDNGVMFEMPQEETAMLFRYKTE